MIRPALGAATAALLLLTACGAQTGSEAGPQPTVTVTVIETVTASPEVVEGEPADEDQGDDESGMKFAAFGDTVTLKDNEGTITISAPQPYTPSDTGIVSGDWDEFVVFDVTETNDGTEPAMSGWVIQATTGEAEAERIFDSAQGVSSPTVDVMPGKSISYKMAFGRTAGAEFVLTAGTLAGWDKAYYQG